MEKKKTKKTSKTKKVNNKEEVKIIPEEIKEIPNVVEVEVEKVVETLNEREQNQDTTEQLEQIEETAQVNLDTEHSNSDKIEDGFLKIVVDGNNFGLDFKGMDEMYAKKISMMLFNMRDTYGLGKKFTVEINKKNN